MTHTANTTGMTIRARTSLMCLLTLAARASSALPTTRLPRSLQTLLRPPTTQSGKTLGRLLRLPTTHSLHILRVALVCTSIATVAGYILSDLSIYHIAPLAW